MDHSVATMMKYDALEGGDVLVTSEKI